MIWAHFNKLKTTGKAKVESKKYLTTQRLPTINTLLYIYQELVLWGRVKMVE